MKEEVLSYLTEKLAEKGYSPLMVENVFKGDGSLTPVNDTWVKELTKKQGELSNINHFSISDSLKLFNVKSVTDLKTALLNQFNFNVEMKEHLAKDVKELDKPEIIYSTILACKLVETKEEVDFLFKLFEF